MRYINGTISSSKIHYTYGKIRQSKGGKLQFIRNIVLSKTEKIVIENIEKI